MNSNIAKLTIDKVKEVAKNDKILSEKEIDNTIKTIEIIFKSSVYLEKIKKDISNIMSDGIIGLNDIPAVIHVILDSKNFIFSLLEVDKKLSMSMMKYVIFSILYYIIIEDGKINVFEEKVLDTFEYTWKLLSYNPAQLTKQIQIKEISCMDSFKKFFWLI